MVFPVCEVADVPCAFDLISPPCFGLQDRTLYANRIEDIRDSLRFFVQCALDFIGDPIASNRMLREDQQEFVIQTDRLFNARPDFIPNLQVFRGKPATDTFTLEISIEAFCEGLILAGVTDKARVEID